MNHTLHHTISVFSVKLKAYGFKSLGYYTLFDSQAKNLTLSFLAQCLDQVQPCLGKEMLSAM